MKKIFNALGIGGSCILTLILSVLIFVFALLLNVRHTISENGITGMLKNIDVVETLKNVENGVMWEDFLGLAETLNLSEEQFEQILNSDGVKESIGSYIGEVISTLTNESEVVLTKEKIENFLNVAVDEYNKVSDTKISDAERQEIVSAFDDEMIANINEEMGNINLKETVAPESVKYVEIADKFLFGNLALALFGVIVLVVGFIALFRFSYIKWVPYTVTSLIIAGCFLLLVAIVVFIVPMQDMQIIIPLKDALVTRVSISAIVLFVVAVALAIGKKYLLKYISTKETNSDSKIEIKEVSVKKEKAEKTQEEKERKLDKKTIVGIIIILLLLLVILFLVFGRNGSYTITFDTDGGSLVSDIEVKNDEIVRLPANPEKEGYTFVGWTNEAGNLLTEGTKLTDDLALKAEWISKDSQTVSVSFDADLDFGASNITLEKGNTIILPMTPFKEGYIFCGWVDENGNLIVNNYILNNDIVIKALWISEKADAVKVTYDTDGGNKIDSIVIENGRIILLPNTPTKAGYVFDHWVDGSGNVVTKDTVVSKDITIKALWKKPYTCPSGCTPIGDGSKCTKITTKDLVTYTGCPSGTETVEQFCSSHKKQISIGFGEDLTYETVGILCEDNATGFCVDYNGRYNVTGDSCPSGYYKYVEAEGLGAVYGCAKKYDKGGSSCPSGYTKSGNKCTKTETIRCTANK